MAEFNGGDVVVVPMPATLGAVSVPVAPDMVIWALPGPAGDIPYAAVEALVDAEFDDRIGTMTTLESSTVQASEAAATAAGTATTAASQAVTARGEAVAAAGTATTAAGSAVTAAGTATEAADIAEQYALEFDLDVTSTTGAPGSAATAAVTGVGPAYQISLSIPRGDKGETGDIGPKGDTGNTGPKGDTGDRGPQGEQGLQGIQGEQGPRGLQGPKGDQGDTGPKGDRGDDGEVSQDALDAAVANLVDNAPEALDTLTELAAALGNDPNFATTVSTEIGKRALIDGAPAAYNTLGKLVTALQNHELGGSTDASLLEGALTDQVDASDAMVEVDFSSAGGPVAEMPLLEWVKVLYTALAFDIPQTFGEVYDDLADKADKGHTHDGADITGALTDQVDAGGMLLKLPVGGGSTFDIPLVGGFMSLDDRVNVLEADLDNKVEAELVSEFPASPTPGVLYLKAE